MKLDPKKIENYLIDSDGFNESDLDREEIQRKMMQLHAKERKIDRSIYGQKDSKRKLKNK